MWPNPPQQVDKAAGQQKQSHKPARMSHRNENVHNYIIWYVADEFAFSAQQNKMRLKATTVKITKQSDKNAFRATSLECPNEKNYSFAAAHNHLRFRI
jgi:hypothetical protein